MDATVKAIVQFFMDTVTAGETLAGSSCSLDAVERDRMRKGNELTQKLLTKLEDKSALMKVPVNRCALLSCYQRACLATQVLAADAKEEPTFWRPAFPTDRWAAVWTRKAALAFIVFYWLDDVE
jgi:hypothetical protein